jgi:hypothetical protein
MSGEAELSASQLASSTPIGLQRVNKSQFVDVRSTSAVPVLTAFYQRSLNSSFGPIPEVGEKSELQELLP